MSIKAEIEKLPAISVRGERYVKLVDVLALLAHEEDATVRIEPPKKADERKS